MELACPLLARTRPLASGLPRDSLPCNAVGQPSRRDGPPLGRLLTLQVAALLTFGRLLSRRNLLEVFLAPSVTLQGPASVQATP